MGRGLPSRVWVFALFFASLFAVLLFANQSSIAAQSGAAEVRRPSRDAQPRPVVQLPPFAPDGASVPAPLPAERAVAGPDAAWSRIVFYDRNSDKWDIYSITGDGDNLTQLTNKRAVEVEPDMSRGGGTVIYSSDEDGDFEIYAMSATGAGAHALTSNSKDDGQPRFSPDNSRIVFVSERDGQAEIYTMRADGSDQRRLTNSPGYDGDPTWSPDGTKIAFSSTRSGGYRIWVMNADGSDPRKLSVTPYSVSPTWSPNGEEIAFAAEGDTDGFLDLMLMRSDGSGEHKILNAFGAADAIPRSWSPDGGRVVFTQWNYFPYQGQWYISSTSLQTLTPGESSSTSLSGGVQYPFGPAWQSLDTRAPRSTLDSLPAQSPADVTVSWSGTDEGGSGMRSFDVDVRLNDGSWTPWLTGTGQTAAVYTGTSGQRLAFRVRARDWAGNVEPRPAGPGAETRIEALPPVSSIAPLREFSWATEWVLVAWDGHDPGGSGISGYTVQYRVDGGAWLTLLEDTLDTHILLTPEEQGFAAGQTVAFRVRAIDRAENVEVWPPEGGDTSTTFFRWVAEGQVTDNTGVPVGGATVTSSPVPIRPATSGLDGDYSLFGKDDVSRVRLTWAKPGYGPLPLTPFGAPATQGADAVLPPADDVIGNGSFEAAFPGAQWTAGGTLPLSLTTAVAGSGETALAFSEKQDPFEAPETLTPARTAYGGSHRLFLVDGVTPVALWHSYEEGLFTAVRTPGTGWTAPQRILEQIVNAFIATDDEQGQVHVVAQLVEENVGIVDYVYLRRNQSGDWSPPESLPRTDYGQLLGITATADGRVHLLGVDPDGYQLFYQQRESGGWAKAEMVKRPNTVARDARFTVTPNGTVVVVWVDAEPNGSAINIVARDRRPDQTWSNIQPLYKGSGSNIDLFELLRDGLGRLHLAWVDTQSYGLGRQELIYLQRNAAGWGRPEVVSSTLPTRVPLDMVLSRAGEPRLAMSNVPYNDQSLPISLLIARNGDGTWQAPQNIIDAISYDIQMAVDAADRTHIAWSFSQPDSNVQLGYRWREPTGELTPLWIMGGEDYEWPPDLVVDSAGRRHLLYSTVYMTPPNPNYGGLAHVTYAVSPESTGPGQASAAQSVTVPTTGHPVLSFRYAYSGATTGQSGFTAEVDGDAHNLVVGDLAHTWLDLSAYRGRTVPITFRLRQSENDPAGWAVLDDVSLGTAHGDVWLATADTAALPGETAELVIRAGNRAGVAAEGVVVTLTLPPELSFVGAAPAPGAPLRWELGALAPGEERTIVVTVQVKPTAKPLTTVRATATATADNELETLNNSAAALVALGRMLYLPGVAAP